MSDPRESPAGRATGRDRTAPPKLSRTVLYSAVGAVLAVVAVLLAVMSRESDVQTSAASLVAEVLAGLPQGVALTAQQITDAARGLDEARERTPGDGATAAVVGKLQERIAEELGAAVAEGRLDQAEAVLLAARSAWPEAGRFAAGGPLARRLREAGEIRELVAEVRDLIAQARDALAVPGGGRSGRLASLKSVVAELRATLEAVQGVPEAAEARDGIRRELADSAQSALDARQPETAQELLSVADGLWQGDPEIANLRQQAARLSESISVSAEIGERLAKARERLAADRLLLPRGDSAVSHFEAVLALDAGNVEALGGLEAVGERYAELAGQALDRREAGRAGTLIENLAGLLPQHARLPGLRDRREAIVAAEREQEVASAAKDNAGSVPSAVPAAVAPAPVPATPASVPIDEEGRVWAAAAGTCDAKLLRVYIDRYPSGRHVDQAWSELSACQG